MQEERDLKIIIKIKMILLSILMITISFCVFFFLAVVNVKASNAIGGYNGANDTQGVWWSDSNYDYRCGWNGFSDICGTFDRALAILYNYQPSTTDTLTFSASIYTQADYTSNKVWNNQVYVIWGYGSNLYYDWTLQDSCTIDGTQTTEHINSLTDRKLFYVTVSCTASPPISGAYPVIYNLQRYSNDTYGGLTNYNFNLGYVNGTITQNRDDSAIINSGNQNTQQIIENQNENTDKITEAIENQNTACETFTYDKNSDIYEHNNQYLNQSGALASSNSWKVSKYLPVSKDKAINWTPPYNGAGTYMCLYDKNKNLIECIAENTSKTITPTQDGYLRFSSNKQANYNNTISGEYCYNRIDGKPHDYGSQPDSTSSNSYMTKEDQLMGYMDEGDLDDIDIDVDTSAMSWIWNMVDRLIHTNTLLTTTIFSILGLGIIKLVLSR